jgi:hypothetical protein
MDEDSARRPTVAIQVDLVATYDLIGLRVSAVLLVDEKTDEAVPDDLAERWATELRAEAPEGNGVDRDDTSWLDSNPDRLSVINWSLLAGREPPARYWHSGEWLGDWPTLFSGRGGGGKTANAQAVGTALSVGRPYFAPAPGQPLNVLMWCCEDDRDELWRRQVAINRHFGIGMADLKGRLHIDVRRGLDNTLYTLVYGVPTFTGLREELREQIGDYKANIVILDNIGQIFGANENARHDVTAFVNGLYGTGAGVVPHFTPILIGHVARAQGSEFAGNAAWENACRMRWYLGPTLPDQQPDQDEPDDPDTVYLAKRKTNYSTKDYTKLVYRNGLFVPVGASVAPFDPSAETAEQVVLAAFDRVVAAGVAPTDGRTAQDYLPKVIKRMGLSRTFSERELAGAMSRLMGQGRLRRKQIGAYSNRHPKFGLVKT